LDGAPKFFALNALAESLLIHSRRLKDFEILEDAVSYLQQARRSMPENLVGAIKATCLRLLGESLYAQHLHYRNPLDTKLGQSIEAFKDAQDFDPDDLVVLFNLGNALCTRFRLEKQDDDARDSIEAFRDALQRASDDATRRIVQNNLGDALFARFQLSRDGEHINQSIGAFEGAISLLREGDTDRPHLLTGLGNALLLRFQISNDTRDIDSAIIKFNAAVTLAADTYRAPILCNLGDAHLVRFRTSGVGVDIENALSRLTEAVQITRDDSKRQLRLTKLKAAITKAEEPSNNPPTTIYLGILATAKAVVSRYPAGDAQVSSVFRLQID
jgi:tetratricopeptide (TPR) repeat protein